MDIIFAHLQNFHLLMMCIITTLQYILVPVLLRCTP